MPRSLSALILCALVPSFGLSATTARGDVFDDVSNALVRSLLADRPTIKSFDRAAASALKPLAKNVEGQLLVCKTTEGNVAKGLVSFGFRKGAERPVAVLMLDRLVTFGPATGDTSVAVARNVMLFPGFEFDLDLGQVVPPGFGGDLKFGADGSLTPIGGTTLVAIDGPPVPAADAVENLGPFAGEWRVDGDGRWKGTWQLIVDEEGAITGAWRSDDTQSTYPVEGRVGTQPHRARLEITLANAKQTFDAYVWTAAPETMTGSVTLAGQSFGFHAKKVAAK
jgi:hypothetical protein